MEDQAELSNELQALRLKALNDIKSLSPLEYAIWRLDFSSGKAGRNQKAIWDADQAVKELEQLRGKK